MLRNLSRRNFFKKSGQAGALLAAGAFLPAASHGEANENNEMKTVDLAVVQGEPARAVARALDLIGGIEKYVHQNDVVLLKPNASFPNPKIWGTTTNPEIVKIVAQLALQAGASRVLVVDNTMQDHALCFARNGLQAELEGMRGVKLIPLTRESAFTEVPVPGGKALKTVKIAKLLKRCQVYINLPCAKSHTATGVSFGLKNQMGLIWDRKFFHAGTDLHTAVAELATIIRPQLTILDATRALVTGGPTGPGKVQELNTIVAGTDPVAIDAYATTLTNWNNRSLTAQSISHLSQAAALGLGEIEINKLVVQQATV